MQEALHIKPGDPTASCEIHGWPTEGLPKRLIEAMRERHGKGGLNVCRDCIHRARDEAARAVCEW